MRDIWRSLSVTCFKRSLSIIAMLFATTMMANEKPAGKIDTVVPHNHQSIIVNGEIYLVEVISDKTDKELEENVNKRIND